MMATLAPALASVSEMARPIPRLPPVTMTVDWEKSTGEVSFCLVSSESGGRTTEGGTHK